MNAPRPSGVARAFALILILVFDILAGVDVRADAPLPAEPFVITEQKGVVGTELSVRNVSQERLRLHDVVVYDCVNTFIMNSACQRYSIEHDFAPGETRFFANMKPDDETKPSSWKYAVGTWERIATMPSCGLGQHQCGPSCIPSGAECCSADGQFCGAGSRCGPANRGTIFTWDGTCVSSAPPAAERPTTKAGDQFLVLTPATEPRAAAPPPGTPGPSMTMSPAAARPAPGGPPGDGQRGPEAKKPDPAAKQRETADARARAQAERQAEAEARVRQQKAEAERRAEELRRKEAELRAAEERARQDLQKATTFEREASTALATGRGDAIGATLMSQQYQLVAQAERMGNTEGAAILRNQMDALAAQQQFSAAAGEAAAGVIGLLFDMADRAEAQRVAEEERAQREAEQKAQLEELRAQAAAEKKRAEAEMKKARDELARAQHAALSATLKTDDPVALSNAPVLKEVGVPQLRWKTAGDDAAPSSPARGGIRWKTVAGSAPTSSAPTCSTCPARCMAEFNDCRSAKEGGCVRAAACVCRCRQAAGGCGIAARTLEQCIASARAP